MALLCSMTADRHSGSSLGSAPIMDSILHNVFDIHILSVDRRWWTLAQQRSSVFNSTLLPSSLVGRATLHTCYAMARPKKLQSISALRHNNVMSRKRQPTWLPPFELLTCICCALRAAVGHGVPEYFQRNRLGIKHCSICG